MISLPMICEKLKKGWYTKGIRRDSRWTDEWEKGGKEAREGRGE